MTTPVPAPSALSTVTLVSTPSALSTMTTPVSTPSALSNMTTTVPAPSALSTVTTTVPAPSPQPWESWSVRSCTVLLVSHSDPCYLGHTLSDWILFPLWRSSCEWGGRRETREADGAVGGRASIRCSGACASFTRLIIAVLLTELCFSYEDPDAKGVETEGEGDSVFHSLCFIHPRIL